MTNRHPGRPTCAITLQVKTGLDSILSLRGLLGQAPRGEPDVAFPQSLPQHWPAQRGVVLEVILVVHIPPASGRSWIDIADDQHALRKLCERFECVRSHQLELGSEDNQPAPLSGLPAIVLKKLG